MHTLPRYSDVVDANASLPPSPKKRLWRILRFWLASTGLYAAFAVCPCCGQAGCPVGLATAGGIGGAMTLLMHLRGKIRLLFRRRATDIPPKGPQ